MLFLFCCSVALSDEDWFNLQLNVNIWIRSVRRRFTSAELMGGRLVFIKAAQLTLVACHRPCPSWTEEEEVRRWKNEKQSFSCFACSKLKVLTCVSDPFPESLSTRWGTFQYMKSQLPQMDFLTSYLIKVVDNSYLWISLQAQRLCMFRWVLMPHLFLRVFIVNYCNNDYVSPGYNL